jgi:ferredoxin
MTYAIAEPCIGTKDTACVDACPGFDEVAQLYIDPLECIDCGACVPVCPVSAIFALDDLPEKWKHYAEINASYVQGGKFAPDEYAKHAPKYARQAPGPWRNSRSISRILEDWPPARRRTR